jgi:SPP1 gp7 family putative phage head morphogenesis protein
MADKPESPWVWKRPWKWGDAAAKRETQKGFAPSRAAERAYERQLKTVAGQIQTILATAQPEAAEELLRRYADIIEPWARQSAANMAGAAQKKNLQTWKAAANRMGMDMRALLHSPGVGEAVQRAIENNVRLIKSLPLDAATRAAEIARDSLASGERAADVARRIQAVGNVSEYRARVIARTEVSKAGTALTRARAADVGSRGYIWRTARDGDTRPSHRAMEGVFVKWDEPPVLDNMRGHAGEFPNCRCYPEPVIPREDDGTGGVFRPALPTAAQERNAGEKQLLSVWERQEGSQVIPHEPGQPLVNVDKATFDMRGKLVNYALNPDHPSGRHKARRFMEKIGATRNDAKLIHDQVMAFLPYAEATHKKQNENGISFNVNVPVTGPNGKTVDVLTAWIYDRAKNGKAIKVTPRLTTIYIPKKSNAF